MYIYPYRYVYIKISVFPKNKPRDQYKFKLFTDVRCLLNVNLIIILVKKSMPTKRIVMHGVTLLSNHSVSQPSFVGSIQ